MTIEREALRNIPLFGFLAEDELAEFSARTQSALFEPHQAVYRTGDINGSMYLVLAGKVRIFLTDRYGKQLTVAQAASGELFGEPPDSNSAVCSATAVALRQTQLLVLDQASLNYLVSKKPGAGLMLIGALEAHLRQIHGLLRKSKSIAPHK